MNQVKNSINFLLENSLFLIFGAVGGLVWANMDYESYQHLVHLELFRSDLFYDHSIAKQTGEHIFTLHYFVNDLLMAFFFAIAGKEVWEATFPGGPLSNARKAATPLIATIGGMAGPALLYVAGVAMVGGTVAESVAGKEIIINMADGWAIPCATDIAFSYMVARIVFGAGHPAIPFLLLLAIADDALGLIILAVFYPQGEVQPLWMLLPLAGMMVGFGMQKMKLHSFWPYLLGPGLISWVGFTQAGLHPALGLLPIIVTLPHAASDEGIFNWRELDKHDTLNEFEHWWKNPVELVLGLFGLLNAGVVFSAMGDVTWLVLAGLLIGKPLGIWLCAMFAAKTLKFGLPEGMDGKDVLVLGFAAGIGFTVALFVATVAFPGGTVVQGAAKMGALFSFGAAILTIVAGKVMGIKKVEANPDAGHGHGHGH
jgi:Na+:H+ antiporter, NhaA family